VTDPATVIGPTSPPGPENKTYTFNPETGMWENGVYAWDPVSKQTKPLTPQTYSYNPVTNHWDTTQWRYDPPKGAYVPNVVSVSEPPLDARALSFAPDSGGIKLGGNSNNTFNMFYNANISNNVYSQAYSGDASVLHNTFGGSALTGDALALANIFNLLQSSASFAGSGGISLFRDDLDCTTLVEVCNRDIMVDPALLALVQPASNVQHADVNLNVNENGQITNNIALDAQTGDAAVSGNTRAGDATTGSANAVANVVNMINSAIASGGSFLGVLNIYGNLNADILLPTGVLDKLLASNAPSAPATTSLNGNNIENSEVLAEFNTNQSIGNNVNATANSGNATVSHNTAGGSATTGNSLTNVNVLNLTGRQLIGANSLLVFVNVLGSWVGVIMDAPAGSTSAALGGGVTQDGCNTCGTDVEIDADTNQKITNNIDVNAQSGDATVSGNTTGGNATSGNATASVNLLNIMDSSFSFSDWFGVLFINVFGAWNGSFGKDTAAGNAKPPAPTASQNNNPANNSGAPAAVAFRFVPTGNGKEKLQRVYLSDEDTKELPSAVQAATAQGPGAATTNSDDETAQADPANWMLPGIGIAVGGMLVGAERLSSFRGRRKTGE
jgi:hypothetical protein